MPRFTRRLRIPVPCHGLLIAAASALSAGEQPESFDEARRLGDPALVEDRLIKVAAGATSMAGFPTGEIDLPGRYFVLYHDSALGEVTGIAEIRRDLSAAVVTLKHPGTGAEHTLASASIALQGTRLTIELQGASPSAERTPAPEVPAATQTFAVAPDATTLDLLAPGIGIRVPVAPRPVADRDRVTLTFEIGADHNLTGTWSYAADPVTQRERLGRGRTGRFTTVEVDGRPKPIQLDWEVWQKTRPVIAGVILLEEQVQRQHPSIPPYEYPYGPDGREGWTVRTLFVYGFNLPTEYHHAREFTSSDPTVRYFPGQLRADVRRSPDALDDLTLGWKKLLGRARPEDHDALRKMDALTIDVRLARGVLAGPKQFTLNGAPGDWVLQFGDNLADIRFVRMAGEDESGSAGRNFMSGSEDTPHVFMHETIQVEVRTDLELPLEVIPLIVGRNDQVLKFEDENHWPALRVEGSRNFYRTPPLRLVPVLPAESERAPGSTVLVAVENGDLLLARLGASDLLLVRKQNEEASRGVAGVARPRGHKLYDAKATVAQTPGKVGGLWRDALLRAAKCRNVPVEDWAELADEEFYERFDAATEALISTFVPVWNLVNRRPIDYRMRDAAAMILLRDEFLRQMRDLQARIPNIRTDEQLRAFRRTFAPYMNDPNFPLAVIPVEGPGELKVEVPYTWLFDFVPDSDLNVRALDFKPGEPLPWRDRTIGLGVTVPYAFAFREDFTSPYFRKYFGNDVAAARRWSDNAIREGLERYRASVADAIKRAEDAGDCDIEELVEITGLSFEPVKASLLPKLMKLVQEPGQPPRWVPDRNARAAVNGIANLAAYVQAIEDLNSLENSIVLGAAAVATLPLAFSESVLAATVMLAVDAADLTLTAISSGLDYYESKQEVAFALGSVDLLGTSRAEQALENEKSALALIAEVGLSAVGTAGSVFDVATAMRRAHGLALLDSLQTGGAARIGTLTPTEARDLAQVLSEVRNTATSDLSAVMKRAQEFDRQSRRQGQDLLAAVSGRVKALPPPVPPVGTAVPAPRTFAHSGAPPPSPVPSPSSTPRPPLDPAPSPSATTASAPAPAPSGGISGSVGSTTPSGPPTPAPTVTAASTPPPGTTSRPTTTPQPPTTSTTPARTTQPTTTPTPATSTSPPPVAAPAPTPASTPTPPVSSTISTSTVRPASTPPTPSTRTAAPRPSPPRPGPPRETATRQPQPAPGPRPGEPTRTNRPPGQPEPDFEPTPANPGRERSEIGEWARAHDRSTFVNVDGARVTRGEYIAQGGFARVFNYEPPGGAPSPVVKFYERRLDSHQEAFEMVWDGRNGARMLEAEGVRQVQDVHYAPNAEIPYLVQRRIGHDLPPGVSDELRWEELRVQVGTTPNGRPVYAVPEQYVDGFLDVCVDVVRGDLIVEDLRPENCAWQLIDDAAAPGGKRWTAAIHDKSRVGYLRDGQITGNNGLARFVDEMRYDPHGYGMPSQDPGGMDMTNAHEAMVLTLERYHAIRWDPQAGRYVDGQIPADKVRERLGDIDQYGRIRETPVAGGPPTTPPAPPGAPGVPTASRPRTAVLRPNEAFGGPDFPTPKLPDEYLPGGGADAPTTRLPASSLPEDMPTLRLPRTERVPAEEAWARISPADQAQLSVVARRPDVVDLVRSDPEGMDRLLDEFGADQVSAALRWSPHDSVEGLAAALRRARDRVDVPRPGLYDGIQPARAPPGWKVQHRPADDGSLRTLTTRVDGPGTGGELPGYATYTRTYDEDTATVTFSNAHNNDASPWMRTPGQTELVPDRGTPTTAYVTLAQMRRWGIEPGTIKEFRWSNVIHFESVMHLGWLRRQFPDADLGDLFRQTGSFSYNNTAITQSGHVVDSITVSGVQWEPVSRFRIWADDEATGAALVERYGFGPDDLLPVGFNVSARVSPHPNPPPRLPPPADAPPPALAHVDDPVPRAPALFVRNPAEPPNPVYLANARDAAGEFGSSLAEGYGRTMTGDDLRLLTGEMHRIIARGRSGSTPSRTDVEFPGRMRDQLTNPATSNKAFYRPPAEEYLARLQQELPDVELTWRRRTDEDVVPLRVEGLPERALPRNMSGGVHGYPPPDALPLYFERGAELLRQIEALPVGDPAAFDAIARYYHLLLNAAPFPQINNSIFMTQVNHLLRAKGVHPGMSHGWLDFLAYQLEFDDFLKVFRLHADGRLPPPSQFGLAM